MGSFVIVSVAPLSKIQEDVDSGEFNLECAVNIVAEICWGNVGLIWSFKGTCGLDCRILETLGVWE